MPRPGWRGRISLLPLTVGLTLALLAFALWLAWRDEQARFEEVAGSLPVNFLGVRPDASDDLLDPAGKKVGEAMFEGIWNTTWQSNRFRRDFILYLCATNELVGPVAWELSTRDFSWWRAAGACKVHRLRNGHRRLVCETTPEAHRTEYWPFWRRQVPLRLVDLRLKFLFANPEHALARFDGPFAPGRPMVSPQGHRVNFDTNSFKDGWAVCHLELLVTNLPCEQARSWGALDKSGQWHSLSVRSSNASRSGTNSACALAAEIQGVSAEDIAALFLLPPGGKVFRNILVSYPQRPARTYAAAHNQVRALLKFDLTPDQLRQHRFTNTADALRVIEVARGEVSVNAFDRLVHGGDRSQPAPKFSELPASDQSMLRRVADQWTQCADLDRRTLGVVLGLNGPWPEFIPRALDLLTEPKRYSKEDLSIWLPRVAPRFTEADIVSLRDLLRHPPYWVNVRSLTTALGVCDHPRAATALEELARDERVFIWWHATSALAQKRDPAASAPAAELLPRLFLIQNRRPVFFRNKTVPIEDSVHQAALRAVPELMTPEVRIADPDVFYLLYQHLGKGHDRATATTTMVEHLRRFARRTREERRLNDAWITVKMVQQLNQWHGTDLGKLGSNPSQSDPPHLTPEQSDSLRADVAAWADARRR